MHHTMSSYTYAAYPPSVFTISPSQHILHESEAPDRISAIECTWTNVPDLILHRPGLGLPCNTIMHTMSSEHPAPESPDYQKSPLADLVCSNDSFLDQLEVMHYLSFSDR